MKENVLPLEKILPETKLIKESFPLKSSIKNSLHLERDKMHGFFLIQELLGIYFIQKSFFSELRLLSNGSVCVYLVSGPKLFPEGIGTLCLSL